MWYLKTTAVLKDTRGYVISAKTYEKVFDTEIGTYRISNDYVCICRCTNFKTAIAIASAIDSDSSGTLVCFYQKIELITGYGKNKKIFYKDQK